MKVLIISHNYVHQAPRAKLCALGALPDVGLSVIVPREWPFQPQGLVKALDCRSSKYNLYALPTLMTGKEGLCIYVGLGRKLREIQPDIIHVEHGTAAVSFAQTLLLNQWLKLGAKTVFFTWVNRNYRLKPPLNLVERFNLRYASQAIAGNQDASDVLRRRGFEKPIAILPLWGIDGSLCAPGEGRLLRQELGVDQSFVVGYVGRLVRAKGLLYLVEALAQVKGVTLLVVGDGPLREEMAGLAHRLGVDTVFTGVVPHAQIADYISAMDVMVLPSLTTPSYDPSFKEQFGHMLIEAMACGIPVIGSSSGEIPHVLGDAGLIFQEGDTDDLAHKLQLLVDSPPLSAELAAKGHQRVMAKYTHERIAEQTYEVYRFLVLSNNLGGQDESFSKSS
jgi:glycosyltransferase involved in cell wall biosynthesis